MRKTTLFLAAPLTLALMSGTAFAAGTAATGANGTAGTTATTTGTMSGSTKTTTGSKGATGLDGASQSAATGTAGAASKSGASNEDRHDARSIVNEASKVVRQMRKDQHVASLLKKAKGVYVVPDFGRGGLIVGGRGGAGVMIAKHDGRWTNPAFFDFGGISIGAQAGGSGGSVAFILMSKDAVNAFKDGSQFSLNGGAGLSIVNYSANAQTSAGKGDIVFWSDTEGAYAGATVSVSEINWDDDNNQAFYGKSATPKQVISGKPMGTKGAKLKAALRG